MTQHRPESELQHANQEACCRISEVADAHREKFGEDALYVFLTIHQCICEQVTRTGSESVLRLNGRFVKLCLQVYHNSQHRSRFRKLPDMWRVTIAVYEKDRFRFVKLLPLMAAAHILGDLPEALCETLVHQEEYESIIDLIIECVEKAYQTHKLGQGFLEGFLIDMAWYLGFVGLGLENFRSLAWEIANKLRVAGPLPSPD